jgi:hypothetical protein
MPIDFKTGGIRETPITDTLAQYPISAQNALQRWDHWAAIRHVIFDLLDFITKLAALVPKPRVNLIRFHGVFAGTPRRPNSKHRVDVTPAKRGRGQTRQGNEDKTLEQRHQAMIWTRGHKGPASQTGVHQK